MTDKNQSKELLIHDLERYLLECPMKIFDDIEIAIEFLKGDKDIRTRIRGRRAADSITDFVNNKIKVKDGFTASVLRLAISTIESELTDQILGLDYAVSSHKKQKDRMLKTITSRHKR